MIDLEDIGKYRENNRIEAKKSQGGLPQSLWETYSAFANSFGGIILLGVVEKKDKSFQTVPLSDPEGLAREFWSLVNDKNLVSANILREDSVQIVESQGNRIVAIEVPRAGRKERPVYIGTNPFSGAYRRSGEGDYHCTHDEVVGMLRDREDFSQDMQIAEGLFLNSLDYSSVRRYRDRFERCRPEDSLRGTDDVTFLKKIGAVHYGEKEILHPTVAGILMFGEEQDIKSLFPHYFLEYTEKRREDGRCTCRIASDSGGWSGNIFDFYSLVSEKITRKIAEEEQQGETGKTVNYALREALANALMHANYHDKHGLVVRKTEDEVVITNPGGMRINAEDALRGGHSDPRNAALIQMFHYINASSGEGSGLSNINAVWQERGWQAPKIEERFNPDRTTLSLVLKSDRKDAEIKQQIIECLTEKVTLEVPAICSSVGISKKHAKSLLKQLVSEEAVVAVLDGNKNVYQLKS